MVAITNAPQGGQTISVSVRGNTGDYAAYLHALVTALVNTDEIEERRNLGTILKAMLPKEEQLKMED